jgi:creatinine amidohydrolase
MSARKQERRWARLTPADFDALKQKTDVALLPIGCVENHGPHNPFGVDSLWGEAICDRAAVIEPAIILPTIYYNINSMMKCYTGTISIRPTVVIEMYRTICEEAARNGFPKILGCISHAGSEPTVHCASEEELENSTQSRPAPRRFWFFRVRLSDHIPAKRPKAHDFDHGGFMETAMTMAAQPGVVKLERCPGKGEWKLPTAVDVNAYYPYDWIRSVPLGYSGDPRTATEKIGNKYVNAAAQSLAKVIARARKFNPKKDI